MKRMRLIFILLMTLSLTGCINSYNYTEKETDSVAEYMAGLLLKYDSQYNRALLPMSKIKKEDVQEAAAEQEEPTIPQTDSANKPSEQKETDQAEIPAQSYTLSEVIGVKGVELQYQSYKLADTYPEDSTNTYFSLLPRDGYKLLVMEFTLTNTTKKDKSLNLTNAKVQYQLEVNAEKQYKPLLTLLENDLQYINVKLQKQDTIPVLLIYELPADTKVNGINLLVSKGNKSGAFKIK